MTEFARQIQQKRKEKELTLDELAKKLKVDKSYLSKLENDRVPAPSKDFIENIAKELFLDYEQLSLLAGRITEPIVQSLDLNKVELFRAMKGKKMSDEDFQKIKKIIDDNKK
jgi:transcriptional regulator with XRE-family HTH domain